MTKLLLELYRRHIPQSRVQPLLIIDLFEKVADARARLCYGLILEEVDFFVFQRLDKALRFSIVVGVDSTRADYSPRSFVLAVFAQSNHRCSRHAFARSAKLAGPKRPRRLFLSALNTWGTRMRLNLVRSAVIAFN